MIYDILPDFDKLSQEDSFLIVIDNKYQIIYANRYTLSRLDYDLNELKALGFKKLADISDEVFLTFYELRKKLDGFNRLRLSTKNFDLYTEQVVYDKVTLKNKHYFIIREYKGKNLIKTDFLVSDIYFHSKDAIAIVNNKNIVLSVNHAFTKLFGYYSFELKGQNILAFIAPKDNNLNFKNIHKKVKMGITMNFQSRRSKHDGTSFDVEISIVPIIVNGVVTGAQIIYRDLSDIVIKGQNALSFDTLASNFLDGITIKNVKGEIIYANQAFLDMTGFHLNDLLGKTPLELFHINQHDDEFYENMQRSIDEKGMWQGKIWNYKKDRTIKPFWLQMFAVKSEDNLVLRYVSVYKDLADVNANKNILTMLGKDILTTMPNRIHFIEKVENEVLKNKNQMFHLAFIDINGFKKINDDYGHKIGDQILIEFAKRMMESFKDYQKARYGGDEFVVFIKCEGDLEKINEKFNEFRHSIKNIKVDNYIFNLDSSIGYATYPTDSVDIEQLIDYADQAMYVAKRGNIPIYKYTKLK